MMIYDYIYYIWWYMIIYYIIYDYIWLYMIVYDLYDVPRVVMQTLFVVWTKHVVEDQHMLFIIMPSMLAYVTQGQGWAVGSRSNFQFGFFFCSVLVMPTQLCRRGVGFSSQ